MGAFNEGFEQYEKMKSQGLTPNDETFKILLRGIKKMKEPDFEKAQNFITLYQ